MSSTTAENPRRIVLGPQRFLPTVNRALADLGVDGPVAVVSAGWQEREDEIDELAAHVDRKVLKLQLYRRAEELRLGDPELDRALHERQESIRQLQELYRVQLTHALEAARELMRRPQRHGALDAHRRAAIRAVRTLDRQHLRRVRTLHARWERKWSPATRSVVARGRDELAKELRHAAALAIAGGHVAVLLNRLRLFDVPALAAKLPIVAWSAGAMALAEQVVLFHDSPPQGPGDAEVLEMGLGVLPGIVPLPHAGKRMRLEDRVRVALFARRFAPAIAVRLDAGARLDWDGTAWRAQPGTQRLSARGTLREMTTP